MHSIYLQEWWLFIITFFTLADRPTIAVIERSTKEKTMQEYHVVVIVDERNTGRFAL